MKLKPCDLHSAKEEISAINETGERCNYCPQDLQCDDIAEWVIKDNMGNISYVCTSHIGHILCNRQRVYTVSSIVETTRLREPIQLGGV